MLWWHDTAMSRWSTAIQIANADHVPPWRYIYTAYSSLSLSAAIFTISGCGVHFGITVQVIKSKADLNNIFYIHLTSLCKVKRVPACLSISVYLCDIIPTGNSTIAPLLCRLSLETFDSVRVVFVVVIIFLFNVVFVRKWIRTEVVAGRRLVTTTIDNLRS